MGKELVRCKMIHCEMMRHTHVPAVAALEQACFSMPWSEYAISSELSNPISLWLVALEGDKVVGYIGSQAVLDEADVMNVAVDPAYRRLGVASVLVNALIEALSRRQVRCLTLEVRASNEPAKALYEKLGFDLAGRRPNYYTAPKEDALILRKEWSL